MRIARGAALAKAPHDILDAENGVIDHHTESDHKARQHHRVEGRAAPFEHQHGRQQGKRYGHDADQRCTHFIEKGENHENDKHASQDQCVGQIVDGSVYVFGRAEDLAVDFHVGKTRF